jgi:MFS transporter, DHA1 family, multidrug resistance protein
MALLSVQLLVNTAHGMFVPLMSGFLEETAEGSSLWSGLIFSSNFMAMMLLLPFLGRIGDRFGRRPIMLWSGCGMAVVTALMAFATEPWQLFALRLLQGCFTGILPFAMVLVLTGAPERRVGVSIGFMQMAGEAGSLLGPIMGASMVGAWPVRYVFPAMSLLIAFGAAVVLFFVREHTPAGPVAAPRQSMRRDWLQIWNTPPFPILLASSFFIQFSLVGMLPVIPYYTAETTGSDFLWDTALNTGVALSATSLAVMVCSPWVGALADRWGSVKILKLGAALAAFLCAVLLLTRSYPVLLVCRLLLGFSAAALMPNIQALIRRHVPAGMEGRTYGIVNSWMFLGSLSGPLAGGVLTAWFGAGGWFAAAGLSFLICGTMIHLQMQNSRRIRSITG